MPWEFRARLFRPDGVGTWTLVPIPARIVREGGLRVRLRLKGSVNGVPFRSTILSAGGPELFLVVPKPLRERIGKGAGDSVALILTADRDPVTLPVPPDLSKALGTDGRAKATFARLAPSHRKAYVVWISAAVKPETRARRIATAIGRLREGRALGD